VAAAERTSEHDRILVAMARFVGAGFCAYLLTSLPLIGRPPELTAGWFTPVGLLLAFGPGVALLAVSFVPPFRRFIAPLAMACAVGYLAASALWFVAWSGTDVAAERVSWLMSFSGLPSMAWILVRPIREAVVVLCASSAIAARITDVARADVIESNVVIETVFPIAFTLSFMLAAGQVVRTGALLDRTRASAIAAVAESAAATARSAERERMNALIHDQVIATLLAATVVAPDEEKLGRQARIAVAELESAAGQSRRSVTEYSGAEAVARIRGAASAIDHSVPVVVEQDDRARTAAVPAAAVDAFVEATGEALRNSLRHAGSGADRMIVIRSTVDALFVSVTDDGVGFDPGRVPPERLGIEVSVRRRVASVMGAWTRLRAEPGAGVTVQMGWSA
jgi:signal transduction histidine kinase